MFILGMAEFLPHPVGKPHHGTGSLEFLHGSAEEGITGIISEIHIASRQEVNTSGFSKGTLAQKKLNAPGLLAGVPK